MKRLRLIWIAIVIAVGGLAGAVAYEFRPSPMINFSMIVAESNPVTDIVVIGDSYSQNTQRWIGTFAHAMALAHGNAFGSWAGFGFYGDSPPPPYTSINRPRGLDGSVLEDNNVMLLGMWKSPYLKSNCPDLSGAVGLGPDSEVKRSIATTLVPSQVTLTYLPSPGARMAFEAGDISEEFALNGVEGKSARVTFTLPAGTRSFQWRVLSGSAHLCGDTIDLDNARGVRVHKLGASGAKVSHWVRPPRDDQAENLKALSPDLYIVMLGTNSQLAEVPLDEWQADMRSLLLQLIMTVPASKILVVMPPQNLVDGKALRVSEYANRAKLVTSDLGIKLLDLQPYFGADPKSYAYDSDNRLFHEDKIHPDTVRGGPLMAKVIAQALGE